MKRDPHDIRKSSIEDAAIDGEYVPRIAAEFYLCPACGKPLAQAFNRGTHGILAPITAYCRSCSSVAGHGKTFDEAVARLREKVGAK